MNQNQEMKTRCRWLNDNSLMIQYHDEDWGTPRHDEAGLFEYLVLSGTQAGLSWSTILNKRENYRKAFDGFNPAKVARYTEKRIQKLLRNPGIIRNRLKITSAIHNAKMFLKVQEDVGSFDEFIWGFVTGQPIQNNRRSLSQLPARTKLSDRISLALQERGFKFAGSTICYAYMQTVGIVNDHRVTCFRHQELRKVQWGTGAF